MDDQFYLLGNMLTSVNSIRKIGKTVISAVGGKLVLEKFKFIQAELKGLNKLKQFK